MSIKMVRKPSETPNITNVDDIIPFRYAYGDQNGYVIGKGNEIGYTIIGNEFKINSGRVVLQGVESDIDANGVSKIIDIINETRYYSIYYKVNLANNETSIEMVYDTAGYPIIEYGDDLTQNSSGIANLELYRFIGNNGVISSIEKVVKAIEYSGTALVGYDISKGTVEERLTNLGFKEGAVENLVTTASTNILKRQGNYVIGTLDFGSNGFYNDTTDGNVVIIGTLPIQFRPKEDTIVYAPFSYAYYNVSSNLINLIDYTYGLLSLKIAVDGSITIAGLTGDAYTLHSSGTPTTYTKTSNVTLQFRTIYGLKINFGYEAKPIN